MHLHQTGWTGVAQSLSRQGSSEAAARRTRTNSRVTCLISASSAGFGASKCILLEDRGGGGEGLASVTTPTVDAAPFATPRRNLADEAHVRCVYLPRNRCRARIALRFYRARARSLDAS